MSETEINLAQAYLNLSGQDPVAALIRSVRDLARLRRTLLAGDAEATEAELVPATPAPSLRP